MSNSTPSAWFPEIIRRPNMSTARITPTTNTAPISTQRSCSDFEVSTCSSVVPVSQAMSTAQACEPTASTTDTHSDHLYGRRNASKRTKVRRHGAATIWAYPRPLAAQGCGPETRPVPETRYAMSGDVSIAYQVIGDGPLDLVYVHGAVGNLEVAWEQPLVVRFYERL